MANFAFTNIGSTQTTTPSRASSPGYGSPYKSSYESALAGLPPVISGGVLQPKVVPKVASVVPPKPVVTQKPVSTPGLLTTTPAQQIAPAAPVTTPAIANVQTPSGATVNGQTGQTINAAPTSPSPVTYPGLIGGIVSSSQGQGPTNPAAQAATDKVAEIERNIGELRGHLGTNQAAYTTGGLTSPVAMGRAQVLSQTEAAQEQGLALRASAAQSELANALATQKQGTEGLTTAAGLAAPEQKYPFVFNPLTGSYSNASGGAVLNPQQAARDVMSGKTTYDQAKAALGYLGDTGEAQLQSAITQSGGNPLQLQASGATTQGVIGQQGTQVAGYQSALQQGQNLQSQLADLITTFGLNPHDINAANAGLQTIARNTSDPRYQLLNNYVNDIANTYSQILTPTGGSQTDTTRGIAASMLDATSKGQSMLAVMQGLDNAAQAKIAGVPTTKSASSGSVTWDNILD